MVDKTGIGLGGIGGREDDGEFSEATDVAGSGFLLKGKATLLFKFIFKLPVGGGTNLGGSFQPEK